ncbi:hypothetical protein D3C86_1973630 [compost metagenome]
MGLHNRSQEIFYSGRILLRKIGIGYHNPEGRLNAVILGIQQTDLEALALHRSRLVGLEHGNGIHIASV